MTPFGARAALARLAASLLAALLTLVAPAMAGDRAMIELIGYSTGGDHFAFEEFGIQDGSGFAYSTIYVIDMRSDGWIPGSPFRAVLEDDGASIPAARQAARKLAASAIDSLDIVAPAQFIALNGDGEPGDGRTLEFGAVGFAPGQVETPLTVLSLDIFDAGSPLDCESFMGSKAKGYRLTRATGEETPVVLHEDGATLPRSRDCPTDYRIFGVATGSIMASLDGAMVILSVYPLGFEGPDRRFLAVPLGQ